MMSYHLERMTEADARIVCDWRYPPPYDRYRWPSWDYMVRHGKEFGDPDVRTAQYLSVCGSNGLLAGYVQLFPLDRAIRLGLGLRPDLCGLGIGLGAEIIRMAVAEARKRRPEAEVDLEVETWNSRAVRAYEKAGFVAEDEYERQASHGTVRVLCMVWQPPRNSSAGMVE